MKNLVQPLKILPSTNSIDSIEITDNSVDFRLCDSDFLSDYEDCVIMTSHNYYNVFGKHRKKSSKGMKLLSVVKLSYNGKSIYRQYLGKAVAGFTDDMIAITPRSWRLLCDESLCPTKKCVTISSGSKFMYYWFHPFHATRVSMRMGIISILISFILSIIGWIFF